MAIGGFDCEGLAIEFAFGCLLRRVASLVVLRCAAIGLLAPIEQRRDHIASLWQGESFLVYSLKVELPTWRGCNRTLMRDLCRDANPPIRVMTVCRRVLTPSGGCSRHHRSLVLEIHLLGRSEKTPNEPMLMNRLQRRQHPTLLGQSCATYAWE